MNDLCKCDNINGTNKETKMPQMAEARKNNLKTQLRIRLSQLLVFSRSDDTHDVKFYGNIYNLDIVKGFNFARFDIRKFIELLNNISGYFLAIVIDKINGRQYLANDIFGNFRVYQYENKSALWFFDDWQKIANKIKADHGKLVIDENEKYYFLRHNYTSGGRTFIKYADKMLPASLYTFSNDGVTKEIYFKSDLKKLSDDNYYIRRNYELISENIQKAVIPNRKNILLFSGGVDSTYIALILKKLNISFKPVFLQYTLPCKSNIVDYFKAQAVSSQLGLKMSIIKTAIEPDFEVLERAIKHHMFDKAVISPIDYGLKTLRNQYGPCNIIDGQSSDSIYCWGASHKTVGCAILRFLTSRYYFSTPRIARYIFSKAARIAFKYKWNIKFDFEIPFKYSDYWPGLLDPQWYLPIIHTSYDMKNYHEYITGIAGHIAEKLKFNIEAVQMYMKLMFLQGPDNLWCIEPANEYGHNLILPFVDSRIVYLRMQFQNDLKNIFHPRYVLEELLLTQFGFNARIINNACKKCNENIDEKEYNLTVRDVYKQWDQLSSKLL